MTDWPQGNADLDYDYFSPLAVNMPNNGYYGFQGVTAFQASTCAPYNPAMPGSSSFIQAAQAVSVPGPDWQVVYMGPDFNGPHYDWVEKKVFVKSQAGGLLPEQVNALVASAYQRGLRAGKEVSALSQPLKGSPPPALERPAVGKRMFRFRALKESSPAAE